MTHAGNICIVFLSLHALIILQFLACFQEAEYKLVVLPYRLVNSTALFADDFFIVNVTCANSEVLPNNG